MTTFAAREETRGRASSLVWCLGHHSPCRPPHALLCLQELIPEFFYLPDFLRNTNHLNMGVTQRGIPVNDIELPPWAHGSPEEFIRSARSKAERRGWQTISREGRGGWAVSFRSTERRHVSRAHSGAQS